MILCNNFQGKWGVVVFFGVGIFSRGYGISIFLKIREFTFTILISISVVWHYVALDRSKSYYQRC